jgi:hypothetical protein
MGLALTLIVGTFSTGLLDSTLAKRNTAGVAVTHYELGLIGGSPFNPSAQAYSDCFATEDPSSPPTTLATYQGACPSNAYTLRVDVTVSTLSSSTQLWSISVTSWPNLATVGAKVQTIKDDHK